jgi:hypothetical protein
MLTALLFVASIAGSHPIHSSSASLTLAGNGRSASIVVRVFAEDLPVGPTTAAVERYLANRFRLYEASGRSVALRLDSVRREGSVMILLLTALAPGGLRGARVWHGVLSERFRDQVNILQVHRGERSASLLFTASDGPKPLP